MYLLDASRWLCGYWDLWYLCDESCVGGTNGHQGSGGSKWLDWVWGKRVMFPDCFLGGWRALFGRYLLT